MAEQLNNVRLCVLPSSAAHTSTSGCCHSHKGEESDKKPARKRVSSRALVKTCAALGQPLFADINTHIKIMLYYIGMG